MPWHGMPPQCGAIRFESPESAPWREFRKSFQQVRRVPAQGLLEGIMPIYEYRCPDCHQVFEEWCKQVEDSSVTHACPVCSTQAKRLISNTSFALKGEGWYVTEYGSHKSKS